MNPEIRSAFRDLRSLLGETISFYWFRLLALFGRGRFARRKNVPAENGKIVMGGLTVGKHPDYDFLMIDPPEQ